MKKSGLRRDQARVAWLFSAPALVLISLFILLPFLMSLVYSFTDKMLVMRPGREVGFVGLENFVKVFTNGTTRQSFVNTGLYAIAVFVNRPLRSVKVFRAIYFSPQVVTMTVVAVVWSFIFSPGSTGIMNSLLGLFGIEPQTWLQDPDLALSCLAVMYIWQTLGLEMLIILGGLQYIPGELYEACMLDGCGAVKRFWYVTVPLLRNTMVYVLVSVTINTLKLFTQVYVLTNGGPSNSTVSVVYQLYKVGFLNNQQGYSSAIAVVFFLIVLAISLLQNYLMREK